MQRHSSARSSSRIPVIARQQNKRSSTSGSSMLLTRSTSTIWRPPSRRIGTRVSIQVASHPAHAGSPTFFFPHRRTPSRKWKQSINTIIASRRFAQAADRARTARATPPANAESTDEDGGGGAGFHTAEEDSDLDSPSAARNADEEAEERRMSEIRHRELEAKRHEREGGPTPPRAGVEHVQQGVEHLSVRG